MLRSNEREEHFKRNPLAWIALNHLLPAYLIRELSYAIVEVASAGKVSMSELFEDELVGQGTLVSWIVRPRQVSAPLERYLQRRIQSIVWQRDSEVVALPDTKNNDAIVRPQDIETAVDLGRLDLYNARTALRRSDHLSEPGVDALKHLLRALAEDQPDSKTEIEKFCWNVEQPLRAALEKHAGDLCADADEWNLAVSWYDMAESHALEAQDEWNLFSKMLLQTIVQSRAAARRTLQGPAAAAAILNQSTQNSTLKNSSILLLNSALDEMVAEVLAATDFNLPYDRRASILLPPELLVSHDLDAAISSWLDNEFQNANQRFWAVLRRQIALGSAQQSRLTKAQYARSLLDEAVQNARVEHVHAFRMGLYLLLESGQSKVAKTYAWSTQSLQAILTGHLLEDALTHATRHAGSKIERLSVLIECYGSWVRLLARHQSDLASQMLASLVKCSYEDVSSPWRGNISERSIVLLRELAEARPEFSAEVASDVVALILHRLGNMTGGWRVTAEIVKLAHQYLPSLTADDLAKVIDSILSVLSQIDPSSGLWPVVQPAMDVLMSPDTPRVSTARHDVGAKIVSTILRFGINQSSERTRLLYYLQDFDTHSLRDNVLESELGEVLNDVSSHATKTNSSGAVYNANALLYASKISGVDGVVLALDTILSMLKTGLSTRRGLPAFSDLYQSLLILANRRQTIVEDTGISEEILAPKLEEIFESTSAVWKTALRDPLIFAGFSFPPATRPNPVLVHNWAYASISFAQSLGRRSEMVEKIELARAVPALNEPIALAYSARLLAGDSEDLTVEKVQQETASQFYSALGRRLVELTSDIELRRAIVNAMMGKCLRDGPRGLDAAVFMSAAACGLQIPENDFEYKSYRVRLGQNQELGLALFPLLANLVRPTGLSIH